MEGVLSGLSSDTDSGHADTYSGADDAEVNTWHGMGPVPIPRHLAIRATRALAATVRAARLGAASAQTAPMAAETDALQRGWAMGYRQGWASCATLVQLTAAEHGAAIFDPERDG